MKGILVRSLFSVSLFSVAAYGDTVVPIGSSMSISSALTDSGAVLVGGILQTQSANVFSAQSPVFLTPEGGFDLNNLQQSVGSLSGAGSVFLGSAGLPSESCLVRLGGGRLALGTNSGFSGVTTGGSVTVSGATVTSGGSLKMSDAAYFSSSFTHVAVGNSTVNGMLDMSSAISGTIAVNSSNNLVLGGNLSGAGGIVKTGAGTLTLTGSNTFMGGTILNSGTLNLAGGSILDNTLIQNGGTLALSGTNYIGRSFNIAGTGGVLTNSTLSPLTVVGAGFTISPGDTVTWSNIGGVLTFTDSNNDLIGSTPLIGSMFVVNVGIPLPPPSGGFGPRSFAPSPSPSNNGVLITGNDNTNRIFSGVISGNGSVVKVGTGAWNLTGNNTYTGLTTVADGALIVNGSIAGDVFVWGGVLGGSGTIHGNVLNQGTVSPGNSPGTLTIAGDYANTANSFLLIQLASPTVYDRVVVGGQASLDGTVAVQFYEGFTPRRGDSFTFLTAAGGITGQFSQLIFPATLLSLGLEYTPNSVILQTIQGSFANDVPGLTPNQRAVGRALDKVVNKSQVSGLVDALDSLPLEAVPGALEAIVPTELLSMFEASIASSTVQADNLERRMEQIRGGSTGFSAAGLHLSNSRGTISGGAGDSKQVIGKDGKDLTPAPLSDRWGFFVNGSGEFVDLESTAIARGTDFTTGGISTGVDYRLGDRAAVGLTAGYANTSSDGRGEDSVKINSGKLGLYGTVFNDGFFLNGGLGGGINSYDTDRETIGGTASSDADGYDFNALLGTGYTYRHCGWSAGPIASLRYSWVGIDGFTEHGSLAPLRFGDQSEASLRSTAGVQASYVFNVGRITVTPEVRAQWQHEYLEASRSIGASFLPGGSFSVSGPNIGRDSLLLDAGVTVQLTPTVGIYAAYTGDLGRQNYSAQSVNGGVQLSF